MKIETPGKLKPLVTRKYVPLMSDFFLSSYADANNYQKLFFVDFYTRCGYLNGKFYYGDEAAKLGDILIKKEDEKAGFINKIFTTIYKLGEKLLTLSEEIKDVDYSNKSTKELLAIFKKFSKVYQTFAISLMGYNIQFPVEARLKKIVENRQNPHEDLAILSFPRKENLANLEQKNILKIGLLIREKNIKKFEELSIEILEKIQKHIQEYGWINARGGQADPWTEKEIFDRIMQMDVDFAKKIIEVENSKIKAQQKTGLLIKELGANQKTINLINLAEELVYFRTYRTDYLNKTFTNLRPLLEAIAKKRKLTYQELLHLRIKEIADNQKITKKEIKRRMIDYALITLQPHKLIFSSDPQEIKRLKTKYHQEPVIESEYEWITFRTRYIPALIPLLDFWSWPVEKILGIKHHIAINIWDKGKYTVMWDQEGKDQLAHYAFNHLLKNIKSLKKIRQEAIEKGKNLVKHCQEFAKKDIKPQLKDFIKFFKKLEKLNQKFIEKSMVYWLFTGEILEPKIKALLLDYEEEKQQEILKIMSIPQTPSYSQIEEEEFEKIKEIAKKEGLQHKKTQQAIKDFTEKYYWFPYEYTGPDFWDIKTVTQRIKESLKKDTKRKKLIKIKEKQNECIKKFNLSKEIVNLFKLLQTVILMQDDRKRYNAQACYYINNLIPKKTAKYFEVNFKQARYLSVDLLKEFFLHKNKKQIQKTLAARASFLVVVQTDKGNEFYTGTSAQKKLQELEIKIFDEETTITEIKGQIANLGIVRGRVRVLLTSSGVKDFKQGDILVSPMTTPDFVPLMNKASAIITDEGGITCHAAIVSRELGIPCIIGTKIATKVFKDGDLVEVDANKGIVKKLKK